MKKENRKVKIFFGERKHVRKELIIIAVKTSRCSDWPINQKRHWISAFAGMTILGNRL
jgi:hypothetical protein